MEMDPEILAYNQALQSVSPDLFDVLYEAYRDRLDTVRLEHQQAGGPLSEYNYKPAIPEEPALELPWPQIEDSLFEEDGQLAGKTMEQLTLREVTAAIVAARAAAAAAKEAADLAAGKPPKKKTGKKREPGRPDGNPIYRPYRGLFKTSEEAKAHRKRQRFAANARENNKRRAADIERVKTYGRAYWVGRIYESMIDVSHMVDSWNSIHRERFTACVEFEPADMEAAAHDVFDRAIKAHERGWNGPRVYHKNVIRGRLVDLSEGSLEKRLMRICLYLKACKANVDDVMRGGIGLALLCDNPEARGWTKISNNIGNYRRGWRLKMVPAEGKPGRKKASTSGGVTKTKATRGRKGKTAQAEPEIEEEEVGEETEIEYEGEDDEE